MCKLPYLHLFKQHIWNISSALDALLGKNDCVLSTAPTKEEQIMPIANKLLAQGKLQNKSLSAQVPRNPSTQMLMMEMGFVHSLEAMRQEW